MKYSELDLEKEAQSQGFQAQSYDLIVAANVIHATRHIGRTLDNLRPLLKPGGRLLMREITQPMRLFDFVFGPLVLPLQDLDAREGGYSSPPLSGSNSAATPDSAKWRGYRRMAARPPG